jgi:hypothetical protein
MLTIALDCPFSIAPSAPTSSTTKTGRHDIAEILLKVVLSTINQSFKIDLNHKKIDLKRLHY